MLKIENGKSRLLSAICLLVIFLVTCSFREYVKDPINGGYGKDPIHGWAIPVKQVVQGRPVGSANALLKPQARAVIVIDPGHGGRDYGTYSKKTPKYQEKHLNLSTAFMLKGYLEQLGYEVIMTRSKDVFLSLEKRSEFANEKKPELFVSLHYNSAPNKEAEGIEVYYYRSKTDWSRSSSSRKLATAINKGIINITQVKSRGVKHGDLAVIRQTNMPAVLVEGGFLTNENEVTKLKNAVYLKQLAWGIALGIHDYLEQNPPSVIAKSK